jgi:hypothetical protein
LHEIVMCMRDSEFGGANFHLAEVDEGKRRILRREVWNTSGVCALDDAH